MFILSTSLTLKLIHNVGTQSFAYPVTNPKIAQSAIAAVWQRLNTLLQEKLYPVELGGTQFQISQTYVSSAKA